MALTNGLLIDGHHTVSPPSGALKVFTTRAGAASKAGHDLELEVTRWRARLFIADGQLTDVVLSADSRSLRVVEGTGGIKALTDEDKANIQQTIHEEVLKGCRIEFRSTSVSTDGDELKVDGELELAGRRRPISFTAQLDEAERIRGSLTIKQTDWGIKPYSALFGTLKVSDELTVTLDAPQAAMSPSASAQSL